MKNYTLYIFLIPVLLSGCRHDRYRLDLKKIRSSDLKFLPEYYTQNPGLPSPALTEEARELLLVEDNNGRYAWFDGTVENGEPFDYKKNLYGKGNQLLANSEDFPGLSGRGIHSETELRNAKTITGRSVSRITVDGRPMRSSGAGFMAEDETILSVLWADNQTVKRLNLSHPDLVRPLFHLWNISREFEQSGIDAVTGEKLKAVALLYHGHRILFNITGSRGWQESLFNDEILGSGQIDLWREMDLKELEFLSKNYGHLPQEQSEELKRMLSTIHTGEMAFFYINRYGFYEGHTGYRADPVAIAFVFGLRSLEELHRACGDDLYAYFTTHFTENPE